MKYYLFLLILVSASLLFGQESAYNKTTYTVAVDKEYEPFEFENSHDKVDGFTPSLLEEIGISAGVNFKFIPMVWPEAVKALENDSVDIINMISSPERAELYDFSKPHSQMNQALFRNEKNDKIIDLASLEGHTVGFQEGDISFKLLENRTDFNKVIFKSKLDGLLKLNIGEIDAFLCAEQVGISLITKYEFKNIHLVRSHLFTKEFSFATRKGNHELITLLNKHLEKLQDIGIVQSLSDKWLARIIYTPNWIDKNQPLFFSLVGMLCALLFLFMFWSRSLHHIVYVKTKSLRESREILNGILNSITVRVFWKDKNLRYLGCNIPLARDAGFERPEDLIGKSDFEMGWKDQAEIYQADDFEVIESGKAKLHIEEPQTTPSGEQIHLLTSKAPLRDSAGTIVGILGTYQDITEHKRAEVALRESEEKYRNLIESNPYGFEVIDVDGNILYSNPAFQKMVGYTQEELLNMSTLDLLDTAEERDKLRSYLSKLIKDKSKPKTYEQRSRTKDGRIIDLFVNWDYSYDNEGCIIGFASVITDITEHKRLEENRKQSELKYRTLYESSSDAVMLLNEKGFFDCNKATLKIFACKDKKEFYSKSPAELSPEVQPCGTDSNTLSKQRIFMAMKNGSNSFEWVHKRIDGTVFPAEVLLNAMELEGKVIIQAVVRDITDRKRAEEELLESEEKFRAISSSANDAIVVIDESGNIYYWNNAAEKMFEQSFENVKGKRLHDLFVPQRYHSVHQKGFQKFVETGKGTAIGKTLELCALKSDGTEFPVELSLSGFMSDGKWNSVGMVRDITERKRVEKALEKSELEYRSTIENLLVGVVVHASDSSILLSNSEASKILGLSAEQMLGKEAIDPAWCFVNEDSSKMSIKDYPISKVIATKKPIHDHVIGINRSDRNYITWVNGSAIPILSNDGGLDKVIINFIDITERKKVGEANARLLRAIEQADETIVITDVEGTIQYVNPAYEKITGYTEEEAIGQNPRALKSGQHDEAFYKNMWETLISGNQWSGEIINKKKDGTLYVEYAVISPVFDTQGKIVNYVAAKNDISEMKRLQTLESRAERLETAGTIAGQVAHDFNNLLAPMIAYPEFIREELPKDHPSLKYLEQIEMAAQKIAEINQQLLTLGRRGHYNQDVVNLNTIVHQAVKDMAPLADNVTCETNFDPDLMNIFGGGSQIHRVITNLLCNAVDALQGNGHINIKTENYYADDVSGAYGRVPKGEYIKLTISDTGCGISDDIVQKILDPFFSTKSADKKHGSGLGMSVVDSVIKDHGGYLDLKTQPGKGTSFYLYFPITRKLSDEDYSDKICGGSETILVVDDDEIQRDVSTQLLKRLGYEVSSVESGEKAIELLQENPHDLVILDMIIPGGIDGTETCKQLLEINPNQKIIIVSGFSESSRVLEAQQLGAGSFVKKPLTKKALAVAVRAELDKEVKLIVY